MGFASHRAGRQITGGAVWTNLRTDVICGHPLCCARRRADDVSSLFFSRVCRERLDRTLPPAVPRASSRCTPPFAFEPFSDYTTLLATLNYC